ncbi:MAG: hypothetical protein LCH56_12785 [Proteobacteria bacterium]|nr:hypothetical protein [Pseudomonadota bacterium]
MMHLERRIALTGKLVWGLCGGAVLGAMAGFLTGSADIGFALGGLIGASCARVWHAFSRR